MITFDDNLKEFQAYLQRLEKGAAALEKMDGQVVVEDSKAINVSLSSGKTILSKDDSDAQDEYEYELVKAHKNKTPPKQEVVNRFLRDIIKSFLG